MNKRVMTAAELFEARLQEKDSDFIRELQAFPKYVPRESITRFLGRYELFKLILPVPGSIIEAGVYAGGGLFTFAQLSAIFEPVHYARKVIGFDSFEGFPRLSDKDAENQSVQSRAGGFSYSDIEFLQQAVTRFDGNRFIAHIPKIELVKGDACTTMPEYVQHHPHLVVAMLYLDFDLFEPTLAAIRTFLPRIPKGGIIAFDQLNKSSWPGETLAALESVGIRHLSLRRFPFDSLMSYAVLDGDCVQ